MKPPNSEVSFEVNKRRLRLEIMSETEHSRRAGSLR
jgi:hypothetical protein